MKRFVKGCIEKFPLLFKGLQKPYRALLFCMSVLSHPVIYAQHRLASKVVAGPGFLGFKGGLFNPGAVLDAQGEILMLAKSQVQHWLDAQGRDFRNFQKGDPVFVSLDKQLRRKDDFQIVKLRGFPSGESLEFEDFRLFHRGDEIWVNHYQIEVIRTEAKTGYSSSRACLSKFDAEAKELNFLGMPKLDFEVQPKEKNWVFFEHDQHLYLLYSFHPFRVLKLDEPSTLSFSTIIDEELNPRLGDVGGFGTFVSYSTNPISYDDQHFLVLIHQCDPSGLGRLYYHWGVLLDKSSLLPKKITSAPLFSGIAARGRFMGVLYVMSAIKLDNEFLFLNGEGDSFITYTKLSKKQLDDTWTDISTYS